VMNCSVYGERKLYLWGDDG